MPREIAVYSLFVPALLPVFLASAWLFVALDLCLTRLGLYRRIWHPALFRASLFSAIFSAAGLLLRP